MTQTLRSGEFLTRILRTRQVAEFVLTETDYSATQILAEHCHEHANLVIVLRGTFTEHLGKKSRSCGPSSVIFRPPRELHANTFHQAGGRCLTIDIAERWWATVNEYSTAFRDSAAFQDGLLTTITARLYAEFRQMSAISTLAIEGLTLELIAEILRLRDNKPTSLSACPVERAREIVNANFPDNISLSSVARSIGMHPVYLARHFRHRYNCTIGEYVRSLRIDFACREMSHTEATIAEIASASGFFDHSHFSKTFKRLTGMTPTQYRKNVRSQ